MNELYDYLEDKIRATSPSQTPTKSAFNQVGDWVIARSTRVPSVRLLPEEVQQLLRSEEPLDRFGALIDLRDLIEGGEPRVAAAATEALRKLTTDDSRRVAAAAQRLLAEEEARAAAIAAGGVVPVTPVAVTSPPIASEAQRPSWEPPGPMEPTTSATPEAAPADGLIGHGCCADGSVTPDDRCHMEPRPSGVPGHCWFDRGPRVRRLSGMWCSGSSSITSPSAATFSSTC